MGVTIYDLSDEMIVAIMSYLKSVDFISAREVDKTIFSKYRLSTSINFLLTEVYAYQINTNTPAKKISPPLDIMNLKPDVLFVREVKFVLHALTTVQPSVSKGSYWISTSWIANAKKYFEAINLPDLDASNKKGSKKAKQTKIRQRRGSDALPPWPSINSDIICCHNNLSLTKCLRAKKRMIDGKSWYMLRKFYPHGPQFKCSITNACSECLAIEDEAKATIIEKQKAKIEARRNELVPSSLLTLSIRKSGVPSDCLTTKIDYFSTEKEMKEAIEESLRSNSNSSTSSSRSMQFDDIEDNGLPIESLGDDLHDFAISDIPKQPLIPGLYNIVPREWLRAWRRFTKDPSLSSLPELDCSNLICQSHGMLVIPTHLVEYLLGIRKSLLSGLGTYEGEIVEIVSANEWDCIKETMKTKTCSEFGIRFLLDGENINWSCGVCVSCDPQHYKP